MPALVAKADCADIGRLRFRRAVEQFVEGARQARDAGQRFGRDAGLEAFGEGRLQHQRRDDRDQIGVAAALADAVQRALDLAHAGLDRGQRIGDRLAGVVMRVDAEMSRPECRRR